ncbi:hypothetical protein FA95DRAFT_1561908 [Auriscalpium vulgare]|uniref:Uncharacterized protein n=1 Tax=Auriscalpium vulgare TaxID=40419 RepID=A0ACB8RLQ7_9AGAM|nr:hypothetical protein FA95DRAFT_1561908 [Auriscalpium vulgare]
MSGADLPQGIESATHDVAVQHNFRTSIVHLPLEILSHIFTILSSIYPPRQYRAVRQNKLDLGWVKITHVCRHWRHVAIQDRILWATNLAIPSPLGNDWIAAFLSRADSVPLIISDPRSFEYFVSDPQLAIVATNLARVRVLHLCGMDDMLSALSHPAPLIHTLFLELFPDRYNTTSPALWTGLLGGIAGAPALRHLRVRTGGSVPWMSPLISQLVSLDIEDQGNSPDLPALFDALGKMPRLERLVCQLGLGAHGQPHRVIALPALHRLRLQTTTEAAHLAFAHLALPAEVVLHYEDPFDLTKAELAGLLSAVIACIDARAALLSRLHIMPTINAADDAAVVVTAWRMSGTGGAPGPSLTVRFAHDTDDEDCEWDVVACALKSLPLEHLEELAVGCDGRDPAWPDVLRGASGQGLRRVTVAGAAVAPFCAALDGPAGFLPVLSTLVISGVDIKAGPPDDGIVHVGAVLLRGLAERARAGYPLKELDLLECNVDEAFLQALREEVPGMLMNVRWKVD